MKTRSARQPLTAQQSELAARYYPLAKSLARPWGDDAESAAMLALVTSASDFRESCGIEFSTFARFRIVREIVVSGKPPEPLKKLPDGHWGKNKCFLCFAHPSPDPSRIAEKWDDAEALLRKLPAKTAQAARLVGIRGLSQTEAARKMKCSQTQVSRLMLQARSLLGGGSPR